MPRIELDSKPKPTWDDLRDMVMISLFNSTPDEEEQLNKEIKILIEEELKNVREVNKRESN
jgi:hypothetical protein